MLMHENKVVFSRDEADILVATIHNLMTIVDEKKWADTPEDVREFITEFAEKVSYASQEDADFMI